MKTKYKLNYFRGQTLVEVIISVAVVLMLGISLIGMTLLTQKSARSARNTTQGTKLAQQSIEQWRIFRDRKGFNALPPTTAGICYTLNLTVEDDPKTWEHATISCTSGEIKTLSNVEFTRKTQVEAVGASTTNRRIIVTVTWNESGTSRIITNTTYLSSWEGTQ